jgi:hypothetical protein
MYVTCRFLNRMAQRSLSSLTAVVSHLHLLYTQLIHAEVPAIYPERELAYLALVSSKDADEAAKEGGGSVGMLCANTDATLVDEPLILASPSCGDGNPNDSTALISPSGALSKTSTSPSVLGKRNFAERGDGHMDVDDLLATRPPLAGRDPNRQDVSKDDGDPAVSSRPLRAQTTPVPDSERESISRPRRRTVTQALLQSESDNVPLSPGSQQDEGEDKAPSAEEDAGRKLLVQTSVSPEKPKPNQPPPLPPRQRPPEPVPQPSYMMFGADVGLRFELSFRLRY